ncbi:MAG: bile acid:sodium symporter [Rhodoglobus sp.]|nr:bile acid:sodium symporter [Rhodoglobus sp.]
MLRSALRWIDPFVVILLATLATSILIPVPGPVLTVGRVLTNGSIVILFLVYGLRLPTGEVLRGLRNVRLQGSVLATTFVIFPILGIALHGIVQPIVGSDLAFGLLYVTLMPSTITSSAAYTSMAGGNVPGAITAATLSNVLGFLLTPALVLLLMNQSGGAGIGGGWVVLVQLILPFGVGQILQPLVGEWIRQHHWVSLIADRGAILIAVFTSVAVATAGGMWRGMAWSVVVGLVLAEATLLVLVIGVLLVLARVQGMPKGDRVALVMAGSAKSLGTGLPMALVLFPAPVAALVSVPVIVFHQLQLIASAIMVRNRSIAVGRGDRAGGADVDG